MKSRSSKVKVTNPETVSDNITRKSNDAELISPKADTPLMTTKFAIPSDRIWNNIEKVLDEQDSRRQIGEQLIASSFENAKITRRRRLYLAAVAGISLLAGLLWLRF